MDKFIWKAYINKYVDGCEMKVEKISIEDIPRDKLRDPYPIIFKAKDNRNPFYPDDDFDESDLDTPIEIDEYTTAYYTKDFIKARGWLTKARKELIEYHQKILNQLENMTKITIDNSEYNI